MNTETANHPLEPEALVAIQAECRVTPSKSKTVSKKQGKAKTVATAPMVTDTDAIKVETGIDLDSVLSRSVPLISQLKRKIAKSEQMRRVDIKRLREVLIVVTSKIISNVLDMLVHAGKLIHTNGFVKKGTPVEQVGVGAGKRKEVSGGSDWYIKFIFRKCFEGAIQQCLRNISGC